MSDGFREQRAIECFVSLFNGYFQKLDQNDIDYKVFDYVEILIAYAEVTPRHRTIREAYPLPISARKMVKLLDKRLSPVAIWSCEDGIIYGRLNNLHGYAMYSADDDDIMVYIDKCKELKYVKYDTDK
jgi:hypothetical protein